MIPKLNTQALDTKAYQGPGEENEIIVLRIYRLQMTLHLLP